MSKLVKTNSKYTVLGLMSGTSLDGVDMALCEFERKIDQTWSFTCYKALTYTYPSTLVEKLKSATILSGEELAMLDVDLGVWYGDMINEFLSDVDLKPEVIASHGHTIFHQPAKKLTLQIGNGWEMFKATEIPVINDFRSKDVSLGGQGAPLVPVGDQLLFADYDYCINLGGIANISLDENGQRIAFDIAPCNIVLNYLAQQAGSDFDEGGNMARRGRVQQDLLKELSDWNYLQQPYPKSLGYEQVKAEILPIIINSNYKVPDVLATYTEFLGQSIASCISGNGKVLITGGGAYNEYLIERIKFSIQTKATVTVPNSQLIDFKEALIFAFLGVLKVRGEVNCLSSVTGASSDNCGGVIYE